MPRRGAFEIMHDNKVIFSKIKSSLFPDALQIKNRVLNFLKDLKEGKDVNSYASTKEKKQKPAQKPRGEAAIYGTYYVAIK